MKGPERHAAFPLDELRKLVLLQDGDLFDISKLRDSFDALKERYAGAGYIDFTCGPQFDIDDEKGVINMMLILDEQIQYRVANLDVHGVDPSVESALRSAAVVGEPFNYEKIVAVLEENKAHLPDGAGPDDIEIRRNQKSGTVSVSINLWSCPATKN